MFTNHKKLWLLLVIALIGPASLKISNVYVLNDDNWSVMFAGEWMVEFVAHWCKNCKAFQPEWEKLVYPAKKLNVTIAKVDVLKESYLADKFAIRRIPTVLHIKDGEVRPYNGKMKAKVIHSFLKTKSWKQIKPISLWTNPSLFQLSVRSQFARILLNLEQYSTVLKKDFGIPSWGTYTLLSVVTFICSAVFGKISLGTFNLMRNMGKKKTTTTSVPDPKVQENSVSEKQADTEGQNEATIEDILKENVFAIESCSGETDDEEEVKATEVSSATKLSEKNAIGKVRRLVENYKI